MSSGRPSVLVIDESFATVRDSGKRIRTANLLEYCARDFAITYVAFADGSDEMAAAARVWEPLGVEVMPVKQPVVHKSGVGQLWTAARVVTSRDPASVVAWRTDSLSRTVRRLLAERQYDLIHCEITQMAWAVPFGAGVPTVLDAHNVETVVWERLSDVARFPLSWVYRDQAHKMERFERDMLQRFDRVVCVSSLDSERLARRFGRSDAVVVPNGVDLGIVAKSPLPAGPPVLLYPGALDWRPAQDGAAYLLREILPRLQARCANARVEIVGKAPPVWLMALCADTPGAKCIADVPSMGPYYAGAHIVVVPLRVGSGSRLKILEAFAYGRPVVSTTVGAEGLDVENGYHLSLADDADTFVAEILRLLEDNVMRDSYVCAAMALVERAYAWPTIGKKLTDVWKGIIVDRRLGVRAGL